MPTAQAGIYELILEMTYKNQFIINIFHFRSTTGDDDEQESLADVWDTDVLPAIADVQNTIVTYDNIRTANLTGELADFNLLPTTTDGVVAGATMTPFLSAPFRYNRTTKDTRNGAKRFTGMVEENCTGVGFEAAFLLVLQDLATALGTTLVGVAGAYEPIILTKPGEGDPLTFTYNQVANVTAIDQQTTQNSRKV